MKERKPIDSSLIQTKRANERAESNSVSTSEMSIVPLGGGNAPHAKHARGPLPARARASVAPHNPVIPGNLDPRRATRGPK